MKADVRDVKKTADLLHRKHKESELYSFLKQYSHHDDAEIQWRLARAAHAMGKRSTDKQERKAFMVEAFEYAKRALEQDPHISNCHKWYAILLDQTAQYKGFRARLCNVFTVKKHFEKAIELDPNDALSLHSVGHWCFAVADLNWYERKLTEALFPCPPRSTYEEALVYFERAEQADPKFFSMNFVMLGKTHLRLGNYDKAIEYLTEACGFPLLTPDDEVAHKEASHLLQTIGHKTAAL
ncbi:regulator of microtubule dynamics protein 1-like isoform X2 [Gigantopelta aegis]|nr:regulator of microtubule dynamics protein 1-like isoform X2 [Gigantopelta aegis]